MTPEKRRAAWSIAEDLGMLLILAILIRSGAPYSACAWVAVGIWLVNLAMSIENYMEEP